MYFSFKLGYSDIVVILAINHNQGAYYRLKYQLGLITGIGTRKTVLMFTAISTSSLEKKKESSNCINNLDRNWKL